MEALDSLDDFEQELLAAFKAYLDPVTPLTADQAIIIEEYVEVAIEEEIEILENKESRDAEDQEILDALLAYQSDSSESEPPTEEYMTEKQVEDAVERYLNQMPKANGMLSVQRQMPIPMGSDIRYADIVLCSHFPFQMLVIVECKKSEYRGQKGIGQLQSYLCATDTQFGIFATTGNPKEWKYYENLTRNNFNSITPSYFKMKIGMQSFGIRTREDRINQRFNEYIEEAVQKRVTPTLIYESTQHYIKEEARKQITEDKIGAYALQHLNEKIQTQTQQISERDAALEKLMYEHFQERVGLQESANNRFWWSVISWALLIGVFVVLLFS